MVAGSKKKSRYTVVYDDIYRAHKVKTEGDQEQCRCDILRRSENMIDIIGEKSCRRFSTGFRDDKKIKP